jgi:hypothetical protein
MSLFRAAGGPIDPGVLLLSLKEGSEFMFSASLPVSIVAFVFYLDAIISAKSSFVKRFFLTACGEARRLAELFL